VAKYKKTGTLDAYSTIKAVARAAPPLPGPAAGTPAGPAPTDSPPPPTAHIARTAIPTKQIIECYECGYTFQLHGRVKTINCSKCRVNLNLADLTLSTTCTETLKTVGTIRLTAEAVLQSGELVGGDVVLEGTVEGGTIRAMRRLELGAGAIFSEKAIRALDLRIAPAADITFRQEARFRNVEILGRLTAPLRATGLITIRPGGLLAGEIHAEHLVVEDGGGLQAALRISPPENAAPRTR